LQIRAIVRVTYPRYREHELEARASGDIRAIGAQKASAVANGVLAKVREKLGFEI